MDISLALKRFNSLQNNTKKSDSIWKPANGKSQIRIVPYKFNKDLPFIELYFHYNINNKTYLSPISFGRPDPIVEFAEKLKRMGDKEDWKAAKAMEPKLRTFVPIIVRGEEGDGVRFWGFGKTVYQEILGYIADPDYGDITDPTAGRDLTVEYVSAEDAGTSYPTTTLRVKPNPTPVSEDSAKAKSFIDEQTAITELYQELSYDELKNVLESWLDPTKAEETKTAEKSVSQEALSSNKTVSQDMGGSVEKPKVSKSTSDVEAAFDDLFNS